MTGHVIGGKLKTPQDADSESLQAKWVGDLGELSLRANDVLNIIDRGRQYVEARRNAEPWHMPQVRQITIVEQV
jgi:8-oxo-dGDP phosphatase